jgi:hypothetical protein
MSHVPAGAVGVEAEAVVPLALWRAAVWAVGGVLKRAGAAPCPTVTSQAEGEAGHR